MSAELQRYRVELGSRMRPAGLDEFRIPLQTTMKKLERAPDLQRAVALSALEESGAAPFHLRGTFTWTSDTGHRGTGTIEEDFYTDRWSRLTLVLDGVRSRRWVLNGRQYLDDQTRAVPFEPRRLLAALFVPLGDVVPIRQPPPIETMDIGATHLRCTSLSGQPPPVLGLVQLPRSVCVDDAGNLRLESAGFGLRTAWDRIQVLGRRHVATEIRVLRESKEIGMLRLEQLSVAPDLDPSSFAADLAAVQHLLPTPVNDRLLATRREMELGLESLDVHVVPLGEAALKRRPPAVMVRVLAGADGRLVDLEVLGQSDDALREQAIQVLSRSVFHRLEWNGAFVSVEGLLIMGRP